MKQMIQPPASAEDSSFTARAPNAEGFKPSPGFDLGKLKQYLHVIVSRIWLVAICFVLALMMAVVKVSKQENQFRSQTTLLLTRGTQLPGAPSPEASVLGDFVDTQVRILRAGVISARAREILNVPDSDIERIYRGMSIQTVGRAAVINISVTSLDPAFSANYANALARSYLEFKDNERIANSQTTTISLMQQANKIREELLKAEDALITYKKENPQLMADQRGDTASSIMRDLSRRSAAHRMERMILEFQKPLLSSASDEVLLTALNSRYIPVGSMINITQPDRPLITVGDSSAMDDAPFGGVDFGEYNSNEWLALRHRKATLEHELRMARENLRDTHPTVRKLMLDIKHVDNKIDREVQFVTEKYYAELEALRLKELSLDKVSALWMDNALQSTMIADRFRILNNDVERLRKLLDVVYSRIREVDISSGIIPDNVMVLEEAAPRNAPINPRKIQSVVMAGLIGIGLGLAIIFGIDYLDDSIRYPEDVSKQLGLSFSGIVPAATWSEGDIRTHLLSQIDPKSGLAEAYRNIRATLLLDDHAKKMRTMLVTSSVPKEGKTTTSLNLAISFAQAGLRVLLVDADMRRGEIHKYFGLEGGRGLSDVLSGQAKTESVIQRTGIPNLDMVATGPFPANPAELILRPEFRAFVDYTNRTYDKIVFDGPPVMAVSEAAVLASFVDSVVMVIWAGKTSRKLCQLTTQNLLQRGANISGVILNNLEFGRVGYYYYSTYYSYYNYDYRYDEEHRGA